MPARLLTPSSDGYFGEDSLIRTVNSELATAFSGGRALLLQAAHPVMFAGFAQSSQGWDDVHGRLLRTAHTMDTIYFGSRSEADGLLARVHRMHARIQGTLNQSAGGFAAGTAYAALQPEYLLWTLACLADSAQLFYSMYVRRLSEAERAGLWRDYRLVGQLFGLKPGQMPATYYELAEYMQEMFDGDQLCVTDDARRVGRQVVLHPPAPTWAVGLVAAVNFAVIGSLPSRIRRGYGFSWSPAHEAARQVAALGLRQVLPWTPGWIRHSPAAGGKLLR